MATWSDSKAVQDYQAFLATGKQEIDLKRDMPSVIVKARDGSNSDLADALVQMGMGDDIVVTPEQNLPNAVGGSTDFPIYITLPPWQLEDFLKNLGESYKEKNENFVFFSGGRTYGNVEDVLKERGRLALT